MKKNLLAFGIVMSAMIASAQTPRMSLVEEFTGETCPPCASYNPAFNNLLNTANSQAKVIPIKWQVPIPSAPTKTWSLYQTNKTEINWRYSTYGYGINSAPSVRIDGQMPTVFGAAGQNITQMNANVFNTAQSYTSAFSITMNRAWNPSGAIDLTVSIVATAPFTSVGNLIFRTVMVERLIQFSVQPGTNGEKDFEDVAIKSYGTNASTGLQTGVAMASSWTIGQTQTFTLSCMPPSYVRKKSEIAFVGFIQDDGDRKVAQAVRADKQALPDDAKALAANLPLTCGSTIAPSVDIQNLGLNAITAMTITPYVDGVASSNITTWTGNLAPTASLNLALNSINAPTTSGSHTFSYNISALNNFDVDPTNNGANATFMVASNFIGTPVAEGFSATAFPPTGWASINNDNGSAWSRVTNAGGFQIAPLHGIKYDFYNNNAIGDQDELFLPPINLTGGDPTLSFEWSYAQRTNSSNDKLDIYLSDNCGATWTNVFSTAGSAMATSAAITTAYTPADVSEWMSQSLTLTGWNKPNVVCKFVTTNDKGNNLYLDNINLSQSTGTGIKNITSNGFDVNVYPNPSNEVANISISSEKVGVAKIAVLNTIGQVVFEKQVNLNIGTTTSHVNVSNLAAGVYNVSIEANNSRVINKLTVTK